MNHIAPNKNKKILFVCYGNICRSPTAQAVVDHVFKTRFSDLNVEFHSAGTSGMHSGKLADPRTRSAAKARGYEIVSRARIFIQQDVKEYDLVVVMDRENLEHVTAMVRTHSNVKLFSDFLDSSWPTDVPDPYYGGAEGFEYVIDMIEAGVDSISEWVRQSDCNRVATSE